MFFSSLSDAINQYIYLKVAHGFVHKSKSDQSTGRHVSHVSLPFEDSDQPHKVFTHEFLKNIQIWLGVTDLFHHSGSAAGFMSQRVLFHESVSISPFCWIGSLLLSIVDHPQVRLMEHVLGLVRSSHPHLEQLLFVNQEFRSGLKELDFSPSFTIEEISINPWKSGVMDVDEEFTVAKSGSSSSKTGHGQKRQDRDQLSMELTSLAGLDWSQSRTSCSAASHHHLSWKLSQASADIGQRCSSRSQHLIAG